MLRCRSQCVTASDFDNTVPPCVDCALNLGNVVTKLAWTGVFLPIIPEADEDVLNKNTSHKESHTRAPGTSDKLHRGGGGKCYTTSHCLLTP